MRYALGVAYQGQRYHGWQIQPHCITVQAMVERALSKIADECVHTVCAGRTDKGVHALGQVIHFETQHERDEKAWILGGNSHLPEDIRIVWAQQADPEFHARFSATARTYRYLIYNHISHHALFPHLSTWVFHPLDVLKMQKAMTSFIGEHDFSSFRSKECQSSTPMRKVIYFNVKQDGRFIIFEVKANAFLHHMVRNMIGSLVEIGKEKKPISWIKDLLVQKNRNLAAATMPPNGLYLSEVDYPEKFSIDSLKILL